MAHSSTYDDDILEWSEQQAAVLRALARARSDLPNELDLEHVAEEIEDVGRSELAAAQSYIRQIFVHTIKAVCDPNSQSLPHWRNEVTSFQNSLLDRVTPSMATRIDLDLQWRRARREAETALAIHGTNLAKDLPESCPLTFDKVTAPDFEFDAAVASIRERLQALAAPSQP